jgi:tetratricopeptide (TPR) repeat protein
MIGAVRPLLIACVLTSGLLVCARPARADQRTEKAREHYVQGDAYYKLDKYSDALHEYEQAYIAKPDPSFLYNIAQCHRLMGNKAEAVKFYRRYLRDAPAAPNRAIAEKHIRDLEAALTRGTEPVEDTSRPSGGLPPPGALPTAAAVPPQSPPPATSHAPAPVKLALDAPPATASTATPPVVERSDSTSAAAPEAAGPFYTKWWFWTAVGAVVVGAVVVGLAASSHDPSCPPGTVCK